ncbi:chemotaxis protein CheA [Pseudomethylobacillus aquaticus]|uniref:Chemotaxis protein CheA n=1 Tax=Pseudomethylobacillus aquaticus TaxID=2676064 RepID=A0A3N0V0L8_9PROT|nr:chemotaxis protein CheA [Pseudomethylobacillus aquaticus]ROH86094.1 chemotaxis protein CheA [Pseudomethylobacillus aquaticus]
MSIDMSQFYEVFFDESDELLAEAEHLLLGLDIQSPDMEDLNAIFRAAHSIKGGAATFGMMDMAEITHVLENLLDKIRKQEMALTAEHVDAFLAAKDVLKMQLDGHRLATAVDPEQVADVTMMLKGLSEGVAIAPVPTLTAPVAAPAAVVSAMPPAAPGLTRFCLDLPVLNERDDRNLRDELGLLGSVSQHVLADGRSQWLLDTDSSADDILSICSFVIDVDQMRVSREDMPALEAVAAAAQHDIEVGLEARADTKSKSGVEVQEEVGYGLFETLEQDKVEEGYGFFAPFTPHPDAVVTTMIGDETPLPAAVEAAQRTTRQPEKNTEISTQKSTDKLSDKPVKKDNEKAASTAETTSIRVGVEKVDQLINLVGELVITQAMIEQRIAALDPVQHERLINSAGQLMRNTRDLQEAVMSIRMMPMDFVFSRFPRMVRDLAGKLGKKVELVTQGASTELDKGLIERIVDPLTHLVRNSVDHGIELPEQRRARGKSETGQLTLSAAHKGGSIVIEVTDDGAGLNRERLLAKAQQNGLPVSENMSDAEVYQLIFAPGFSTAEAVTDVSGRGVGMDVVKRNITAMNGTVEIRSVPGLGTTISIALPLTLAILDGMSVSLGSNIYVIPLNLIVETLQPRAQDIKTVTGEGRMVHVRGEYLPIIALHSLFNHDTDITDPTQGVLVLIEAEGRKSALFVDGLVGQQQVVIKSLETNYRRVRGISGATIMGDGSVALILDVPAIIQMGQSHNYITGAAAYASRPPQTKEYTQ